MLELNTSTRSFVSGIRLTPSPFNDNHLSLARGLNIQLLVGQLPWYLQNTRILLAMLGIAV